MNRRGFLGLLGAAVGGMLLDQTIPFNRVWSFPKEIVIANQLPEVLWGIPYFQTVPATEWHGLKRSNPLLKIRYIDYLLNSDNNPATFFTTM